MCIVLVSALRRRYMASPGFFYFFRDVAPTYLWTCAGFEELASRKSAGLPVTGKMAWMGGS